MLIGETELNRTCGVRILKKEKTLTLKLFIQVEDFKPNIKTHDIVKSTLYLQSVIT
jgi:hypothetical protein